MMLSPRRKARKGGAENPDEAGITGSVKRRIEADALLGVPGDVARVIIIVRYPPRAEEPRLVVVLPEISRVMD